ncbi:MAG TPA: hypothetical protein VN363_06430 [Anaerolineales bacterium]|nr:hypothetical protein [Anaerolineales bacterium]
MPADLAPQSPSLFVLGDSISIHYGPFLERILAGCFVCDRKGSELLRDEPPDYRQGDILQRLAVLENSSDAINGGDSACVLAYLQVRCMLPPPGWTVLLLNCGLHDLRTDPQVGTHQVDLEAYAVNLSEILRLAALLSRRVVWLRTTPVVDARHQRLNPEYHRFNADVELYNRVADQLMDRAGIPIIDLYGFTHRLSSSSESLDALYSDHVHFIEPVQQLQAAYIAGWLDACSFS